MWHNSSFRRKPESGNHIKKQPAVYILESKKNATLYIGVTSNLVKRVWQHKNNLIKGFTKRYNVHNKSAIKREKALKYWKRSWKLGLIEKFNPNRHDLYEKII